MAARRAALATYPIRASSDLSAQSRVMIDEFEAYRTEGQHLPPAGHHILAIGLASSRNLARRMHGGLHVGRTHVGDALILSATEPSSFEGSIPDYIRIGIETELVDEMLAEGPGRTSSRTIRSVPDARDPVMLPLAQLAALEIRRPAYPGQRLSLDAVATIAGAQLLRLASDGGATGHRTWRLGDRSLARVLALLDADPAEHPSLDDLAQAAGMSRFAFLRAFRARLGETPIRYLERKRMQEAIALLRFSALNVSEIAATCGYADHSHFTRRFRTVVGCTPSEYRAVFRAQQTSISATRYKTPRSDDATVDAATRSSLSGQARQRPQKKENPMAISDALAKLAAQSKQLEDSVETAKSQQTQKAKDRVAVVRSEIDETNQKLDSRFDAAEDKVSADWADLHQQVSEKFQALRDKASHHKLARKAARAEDAAEWAEADAEDAIDFAVYALQEAEYSILNAVAAELDADDAAAAAEL